MPARVVLQDFTGVPCVVDLAAMRDAVVQARRRCQRSINPLIPSELVIDHSVQVDVFGRADALDLNGEIEFERNRERYSFLRWGQKALQQLQGGAAEHRHRAPGEPREPGARGDGARESTASSCAFPDTVFGTDSHTTMINGIGVLGWGVGGIEAEAAMLGQPSSMLIPQVVGFKLTGKLPEGATATDLVLTVTQMLRKHGVVGKFVEFYGDGLQHLPLADRATIANMAPEYGATCGIFPIDAESLTYLRLSGRSEEQIALVEAYAKAQGLWHDAGHAARHLLAPRSSSTWPTSSPRSPARSARRTACCSTKHARTTSTPTSKASPPTASAKKTEVVRFDAEGGDQPQAEHLAAQAEVEDPHRTTRTANSPTARS